MPIRNQNWYNANETRRYPLDENSTGRDDTGLEIRENIFVDCNISFSSALGACVYVQGITVSRGLVSVVFGAADADAPQSGYTVATVTVAKPITKYRHYTITPLVDGIDGWVVFGAGVEEDGVFRFSAPAQSLIAPRCAYRYAPLPVPHMRKAGVGTALSDVITFEGLTPVVASYEKVVVEPTPGQQIEVDAIVFKLDTQQITEDYNPLAEFVGPCGGRPESGTCGKEPIEFINGVEPGCDGNITIEFTEPLTATNLSGCGGVGVDLGISLTNLCAALEPKKPREFSDKCCKIVDKFGNEIPQSSIVVFSTLIAFPPTGVVGRYYLAFDTNRIYYWAGNAQGYVAATDDPIDAFCWPKIENIDPDIIDGGDGGVDLNLTQYECIEIPPCIDFVQCSLTDDLLVVEAGGVERAEAVAPTPCPYCDGTVPAGGSHGVLNINNIGAATVYALKKCRTDWFSGKSFTAELQLPLVDPGYERIGGLVFNYFYDRDNLRVVTRYFALVLNRELEAVQVWGYTGNQFVNLSTTYVNLSGFENDDWFSIKGVPGVAGNSGTLYWVLKSSVGTMLAEGTTAIPALYFTKYGLHGLYGRRSFVNFNKLQVTE